MGRHCGGTGQTGHRGRDMETAWPGSQLSRVPAPCFPSPGSYQASESAGHRAGLSFGAPW